jgi:hypothetical protein
MESGQGVLTLKSVNPFIVVSDQTAPTLYSNAKFVKIMLPTATPGEIQISSYMYWDTTVHLGFGLFGSHVLHTLDSASFVYDFRGGTDGLIIQTRLGSTWDTFSIDTWTGDVNLVEAATVTGNTVADAAAGDSTITLGVGEGAQFTDGKFYFLYDLNLSEAIDYVQVISKVGDVLTLNETLIHEHKTGALLVPYYQRFYTWGTDITSPHPEMSIPCRSHRGREFGLSLNLFYFEWSEAGGHVLSNLILNSDPNDEGKYIVMKPLLGELPFAPSPSDPGNRSYGIANNLYYTAVGTMAQMLNGKTINAKEWVYTQTANLDPITNSSLIARLIPNFNEV